MAQSILQPDGQKECYLTGCQSGLDKHHIYAGPNRRKSELWGCWVWLKHSVHMDLHERNKALDRMLKEECQREFEKRYPRKTFMSVFGKSYL